MQKECKTIEYLSYSSAKNWVMLVLVASIMGSAVNALLIPVILSSRMLVDVGSVILAIFGWINLGLLVNVFVKISKKIPVNRLVFKLIYVWLFLNFVVSLSNLNTIFNLFTYVGVLGYYGSSFFSALRTGVIIFQLLMLSIPVLVVYITDKKVAVLERFHAVEESEMILETVQEGVVEESNTSVVTDDVTNVSEESNASVVTEDVTDVLAENDAPDMTEDKTNIAEESNAPNVADIEKDSTEIEE